jgi:hypothetical protein
MRPKDNNNKLAAWAKAESAKLGPAGSPLETDVLKTWERNNPPWLAELKSRQAEKALALVDRMLKAE